MVNKAENDTPSHLLQRTASKESRGFEVAGWEARERHGSSTKDGQCN